jgi:hypothetical protein
MYTREQASQIRKEFWTAFGSYMAPIKSAEGVRINWLNYKTGLKNVYFRLDADKRNAFVGIEITHPDEGIQELFFEQFQELKTILKSYLNEEWEWLLHTTDENGKTICRIYTELNNVNVFNKNDWPALISFFKPRILALDEFWSDAKYSFESLK